MKYFDNKLTFHVPFPFTISCRSLTKGGGGQCHKSDTVIFRRLYIKENLQELGDWCFTSKHKHFDNKIFSFVPNPIHNLLKSIKKRGCCDSVVRLIFG